MSHIKLVKIDRMNLSSVLKLKIYSNESEFVAPNSISLSEAYVEEGLFPRAIELNGKVIGFIMFGQWEGETSFWITRLMIDKNFRGKGYAKEAIQLAVEQLINTKNCSKISISFEPENIVARKLYTSLGFIDTGHLIEDELLFELGC